MCLSYFENASILLKMCAFTENACILCKLDENARILLKMHKTKFSEIGLASSKGISSKDPINLGLK